MIAVSLNSLSPSRAGDFKTCPQLYKFRSIDKLDEPATVYQARGTTAHLALQNLYDLEPSHRTPEALYDLFREAWRELRGTDEFSHLFDTVDEEREWGLESMALLRNYFAIEDPVEVAPLDRELDMLEELDGITIRGILDRIDETPSGDLIITDYKTGKAPPERFALPAFFALKIYALLIRNRLGRTPVELRLLYLNGPTLYRLPVNDTQLNGIDRQLRALWTRINRSIEADHFPPKTGPLCNWCSFQSLCPAWENIETATEQLAASA